MRYIARWFLLIAALLMFGCMRHDGVPPPGFSYLTDSQISDPQGAPTDSSDELDSEEVGDPSPSQIPGLAGSGISDGSNYGEVSDPSSSIIPESGEVIIPRDPEEVAYSPTPDIPIFAPPGSNEEGNGEPYEIIPRIRRGHQPLSRQSGPRPRPPRRNRYR